jgi:DNA-binding beta-propeller fold protein YncE
MLSNLSQPRHRRIFVRMTLSQFLVLATAVVALHAADPATKRYLYMSTPDGAQEQGRSGDGILVFDIDADHKFVRRITIPSFREGLRGFTPSAANHCAYYSTTSRRLGCVDLETDKVLWEQTYNAGCDRSSVSADGTKVFVPSGWWYKGEDSGFLVVDAKNGNLLRRITVGPQAHNSIVTLDGRYVFLGTDTMLTMFDARDEKVALQVKDVGEFGVFPFTVDSQNRYAYVCLGKTVGFDVVDLKGGKAIHRVIAGDQPIKHRTHGAGLTPDEKELWISDQDGQKLFIFDATQMPPKPKGDVPLTWKGHGWICFSLDGRYAWSHTPDVYDARTKKRVTVLTDENARLFASSKFFEVHFRDGKVVQVGNEFAFGRAQIH